MAGNVTYSIGEQGDLNILEISGNLSTLAVTDFLNVVENFFVKDSLIISLENINLVTISGLNAMLRLNYHAKELGKRVIFLYPSDYLKDLVNNSENYGYLTFADSIEECRAKLEFFD